MFMFRLALYLRALKTRPAERGVVGALAYFFMLPNLAFPLFPVVDYQTFRRTHYDKDEAGDLRAGPAVDRARPAAPAALPASSTTTSSTIRSTWSSLGDLVQFMLGTFLLYLRVSGQFHLIVGLLHLFGFRLPETHKLYYLAHSFTELWRRINIYWTDFMMKTVFYPTYFKVKKLGPATALVHLDRGGVRRRPGCCTPISGSGCAAAFPLTPQDTLFWGILGALVVVGALRELKARQGQAAQAAAGAGSSGCKRGDTFSLFCFLWSLWSTESVGAVDLDARRRRAMSTARASCSSAGTFVDHGVSAAATGKRRGRRVRGWLDVSLRPPVRTLATLARAARRIAQPAGAGGSRRHGRRASAARRCRPRASTRGTPRSSIAATTSSSTCAAQLNARGAGRSAAPRARLARSGQRRHPARPQGPHRCAISCPRCSVDWNGNRSAPTASACATRSIRWRSRRARCASRCSARRMSWATASPTARRSRQLVEDRLNRELGTERCQRFEILNFGVDGFSLPQQLAMLEDRVLAVLARRRDRHALPP